MNVKLIGLCGAIKSGKDTLATMLESQKSRDQSFKRYAFADALKEEVLRDTACCGADIGWTGKDYSGPKSDMGRAELQRVGALRRTANPEYWVDQVAEKIKRDKRHDTVPVITDVRHVNEINWIIGQSGGMVIYIYNPSAELKYLNSLLTRDPIALHESELQWRAWMLSQGGPGEKWHLQMIKNDGGLIDFAENVKMFMES